MKNFCGDFETATWNETETWVWAWCTIEIGNEENIQIGNSIESFIEFCKKEKNPTIYFHNLKFDGSFIIWWLLKNGFEHIIDRKDKKDRSFTTLISDIGQFYQIEIFFEVGNKKVKKVKFIDSLKIIPLSVDEMARSFGLEISKLKIDYNMEREIGHILTKEEEEYIKNDVLIVAKSLKTLFDENLKKMTQGSNALSDFKGIIGDSKFLHYFPPLDYEVDKDIRQAYKGRIYLFKSNL